MAELTFREIDRLVSQGRRKSARLYREQTAKAKELYKEIRGLKIARGFKGSEEKAYIDAKYRRRERYWDRREIELKFPEPEPTEPGGDFIDESPEGPELGEESEWLDLTDGPAPYWEVHDLARAEIDSGFVSRVVIHEETRQRWEYDIPIQEFRCKEKLAEIYRYQQQKNNEAKRLLRKAGKLKAAKNIDAYSPGTVSFLPLQLPEAKGKKKTKKGGLSKSGGILHIDFRQ